MEGAEVGNYIFLDRTNTQASSLERYYSGQFWNIVVNATQNTASQNTGKSFIRRHPTFHSWNTCITWVIPRSSVVYIVPWNMLLATCIFRHSFISRKYNLPVGYSIEYHAKALHSGM